MKVFAAIIYISHFILIFSVKLSWKTSIINKEDAIDDMDLTDFQKLLNRFNLLSNDNTKNFLKSKGQQKTHNNQKSNFMPRMRFTQLGSSTEESEKDENLEAMDFEIKFPNDKENFLIGTSQDKEIKRKEGLSNGLVLCNNKRTLNIETSDYSYLYFDLFES